MASRVVTRVGKDAPKFVQVLRNAAGFHPSSPTASMLMNRVRQSQQAGISQLASSLNINNYNHHSLRYFSDKTAPPPPPEGEEKPAAESSEEAAAKEETEAATAESAEPEISREEQLEKELKIAKDQLLRSLAEQENTRRIAQRDVQDARNFAVKSFAKSLLDVSDNLSRALEVVPENMRHDKEKNPTLATLYEGIQMTESGLMKAFEMNGLKKYGKPGEVFDPNKHSALYEYPDPEKKPGTIGQVIKVGFLLNDRVLRPAEVGVVKKED